MKKMFRLMILLLAVSALLLPAAGFAFSSAPQTPPLLTAVNGGFILHNPSSGFYYRLTSVTSNSLRITVGGTNEMPDGGTFISPSLTAPAYFIYTNGRSAGVSNSGGALEISLDDGRFILKNASGQTVYGPAAVSYRGAGQTVMTAEYPAGERAYGVGNGPLVKTRALSFVGNTVTRLPMVWTTSGYGILVHYEKPNVNWIRDGQDTWTVPDSGMDVYFFLGRTPYDLINSYTLLTGRPLVPPRWSFGYLQSRWGYKDYGDVRNRWLTFRQKRIPVDAFIYDYDWFSNDWAWNDRIFPDPVHDTAEARSLGIKLIGIRKPRVNGDNLAYARRNKWVLAKGSSGTGDDVDFSKPDVRAWWWSHHEQIVKDGMAGWWNDEAEQSFTEYFWMVTAESEGLAKVNPGARCWTINRTFSPGLQRLGGMVWTGDITCSWDSLKQTPLTLLSYGFCGVPYSCSDTGGFRGRPSAELFARWQQQSAFTPIMRAHGGRNSDRWPWAFGPEAENSIRVSIETRYRLIPYLYSLAHESYISGAPLMRPLFFEFPGDGRTFDMSDEWLLGPFILCAPLMKSGEKRSVYFPAGKWYEFGTGKAVTGPSDIETVMALDDIPAYFRAGAIVPQAPLMQYSDELPLDLLTIDVFAGSDGAFTLYEDDGNTLDYTTGAVALTRMEWSDAEKRLTIHKTTGRYSNMVSRRSYIVRLHGAGTRPSEVSLNDVPLKKSIIAGRDPAGWAYDPSSGAIEISSGTVDIAGGDLVIQVKDKGTANFTPEDDLRSIILRTSADALRTFTNAPATAPLEAFVRLSQKEPARCTPGAFTAAIRECMKVLDRNAQAAFLRAVLPLNTRALITLDDGTNSSEGYFLLDFRFPFPGMKTTVESFVQPPYRNSGPTTAVLSKKEDYSAIKFPFSRPYEGPGRNGRPLLIRNTAALNVEYMGLRYTAVITNEKLLSGESLPCYSSIGPFLAPEATNNGFDNLFPPETNMDLAAKYENGGRTLRWKTIDKVWDNSIAPGELNLVRVCSAYAAFWVYAPQARDVTLSIGSSSGMRVWINGRQAYSFAGMRELNPGTDNIPVRLETGWNAVLVKTSRSGGGWGYYFQFRDGTGNAVPELLYSPAPVK